MTSIAALFVHGIMLMALLLLIFQVRRWKQYWPIPYLVSAVIIVLPIQNWLLIEFSRGYFSNLSMATLMVCLIYVLTAMRPKVSGETQSIDHSFKVFILLLSVVLFPSSMGAFQFDVFALGFPSEPGFDALVSGLLLVGLFAWYKGAYQLAVYVTLVFLSYGLGLYESQNIWIYMLDPIVMMIFMVGYLMAALKMLFIQLKTRLVNHA